MSAYVQHILTKLVPNESLDIAHYVSIHISKLPLLHIQEVLFNLFVFVKRRKPSKLKLNFVYIFYFHLSFWVIQPLIVMDMMMSIKLGICRHAESNPNRW